MASDVIEFDASVIGLTVGSVSGNLLIGGGDNQVGGRMRLYDASNNYALLNDFPVQSVVQSVAFASDESFFLSSGNLGRITFWNSQTYANQSVLVPGTVVQVLYEVLVTDNSLYIAAAGNSNAYSWQRASIGAAWTENTPIPSDVENIALSPSDGLLLVVAGSAINEYSLCSTKEFYSSANDNCVACPKDECQECYGTTG
jgi:WD40 repeat protein